LQCNNNNSYLFMDLIIIDIVHSAYNRVMLQLIRCRSAARVAKTFKHASSVDVS